MTGHGRTLTLVLVDSIQPPDVVWVPMITLPWRPDELDRAKPDIEERAS